jgi:hypothetical protein
VPVDFYLKQFLYGVDLYGLELVILTAIVWYENHTESNLTLYCETKGLPSTIKHQKVASNIQSEILKTQRSILKIHQ